MLASPSKLTSTEWTPPVASLIFSGASMATILPWLIMATLWHNWFGFVHIVSGEEYGLCRGR